MLRVVMWKWGRRFTLRHVRRLASMIRRHLHMPHELVLITDDRAGVPDDIRIIPLWGDLRRFGKCTVRLKAFRREMADLIGPRFAWIDLDVVITGDITPLLDRPEPFVICGRELDLPCQPYNGSVVLMDAGAREKAATYDHARFVAEKAARRYGGSDQAWIAIALGEGEATWGPADGVYSYRNHIDARRIGTTGGRLPKDARMVILNGPYDPASADLWRRSPWVKEHWH